MVPFSVSLSGTRYTGDLSHASGLDGPHAVRRVRRNGPVATHLAECHIQKQPRDHPIFAARAPNGPGMDECTEAMQSAGQGACTRSRMDRAWKVFWA